MFFFGLSGSSLLQIHLASRTWFVLLRVTCTIRLTDATAAAWRTFAPEKRPDGARGEDAFWEDGASPGETTRGRGPDPITLTEKRTVHRVRDVTFLVTSLTATGLVRQAANDYDGTYYTWVCTYRARTPV